MSPIAPELFPLWLFLHVLGAVVAFGFGFTAPVIARQAMADPQHIGFWLRASKRVGDTILLPATLSLFVTGVLLVLARFGSMVERQPWMVLSLVLYFLGLGLIFAIQRPTLGRLISATAAGGAPGPETLALARKLKMTGYVLSLFTIVILFLMVVKPAL